MRTDRRLVLKRETLAELTAADLRQVVGADSATVVQLTTPPRYCITDLLTCYDTCMSWHTEEC